MASIPEEEYMETLAVFDKLTEHEGNLIARWFSALAVESVKSMLEYRYEIGAECYDPSFKEGFSTAYEIALEELEKIGRNLDNEVQG